MRLIDGDELYQKVVGYNGGAVDKTVAKRLIDQMPTVNHADVVSRRTFEQIKWERDTAVKQLEELGYGLGEKVRSCKTCRYNYLEWHEEPCDSCTSGGESNHWKPTLQRWISCDEKIPDAPFRVLVQLTNSWMVTAYYEESEWRFVSNEFCGIENDEVVAWMPLPEPYKEEQHG